MLATSSLSDRFLPVRPDAHSQAAESSESKPLKQAGTRSKPIALNLNENPFGPSPLAIKAIQSVLDNTNRYPQIQASDLHEAIADFSGVSHDQVLVTAGATELLSIIARLNAITSAKSFIVYKLETQVTEGKLIEVPALKSGYDLNAISHEGKPK